MALYPELFRIPARLRQVLLALSIGIIVASSMRKGGGGPPPFFVDFVMNLGHQFLYGFFALTALLRLHPSAPLRRSTWVAMLCLVFVLGILDEWNQGRSGHRGVGMFDVISDCLGCFHILVLCRWFSRPQRWGASLRLMGGLAVLGLSWNLFLVKSGTDIPIPFLS
jgi:VanZ family protein